MSDPAYPPPDNKGNFGNTPAYNDPNIQPQPSMPPQGGYGMQPNPYGAPPPGQYGGAHPGAYYGPPPPGNYGGQYGGQYQPPQNVIIHTQPQPTTQTVVVSPGIRPSDNLALAIFTTLCCNLLFGIIAIIFSVMSSSDADAGDMESARTKGRISMGLSIAGIVLTIIAIVFVIIYFTVIVSSALSIFG